MNVLAPLIAVLAIAGVAWVGGESPGLNVLFGVVIPYAALVLCIGGIVWRVLTWARAPVPFNISTTCGQQKSLPWIRSNPVDNPSTKCGVFLRMVFEVLCFRSLFRNTRCELVPRKEGGVPRIAYRSSLWLWIAALAFHFSFLAVLIRHYRFFSEPVPVCLGFFETLDGFLQIGSPVIFMSGFALLGAAAYLLARRLAIREVRYISLANDYFPLYLILGIAGTGLLMRYTPLRVDITEIKDYCMGLMRFQPVLPSGEMSIFYAHLALICILFAYLPFSKISHVAGIFFSPTRNLIGASRMVRHVNPWNYPVKVHTYEEYEDEFRDKMKGAGIPVDKE